MIYKKEPQTCDIVVNVRKQSSMIQMSPTAAIKVEGHALNNTTPLLLITSNMYKTVEWKSLQRDSVVMVQYNICYPWVVGNV